MAAPAVDREARGVREVPTLRLTTGASLEEEEEEEAAARRARSFAQDARVRFLGSRLQQMLGLPAEKWAQYLESEDNRQVLGEFLESPSPACLVFSVGAAGRLAASREVRSGGKGPGHPPAQHNGGSSEDRPVAPPWVPAGHALGRFTKLFLKSALDTAECRRAPTLQGSGRRWLSVGPGASATRTERGKQSRFLSPGRSAQGGFCARERPFQSLLGHSGATSLKNVPGGAQIA